MHDPTAEGLTPFRLTPEFVPTLRIINISSFWDTNYAFFVIAYIIASVQQSVACNILQRIIAGNKFLLILVLQHIDYL